MKEIWKFKLDPDVGSIPMPKGAKILTVQTQNNEPCLWALVKPDNPVEQIAITIVATGWPFDPTGLDYVGTFQLADGAFVFHVFKEQ